MSASCPKCGAKLPTDAVECPACGVVLAKAKAPKPWLGPYVYKMVQAAEHVVADEATAKGNEAGAYLEKLVNSYASQGWEFFRVDEMMVSVSWPGILGTRGQGDPKRLYVVTFRKPA